MSLFGSFFLTGRFQIDKVGSCSKEADRLPRKFDYSEYHQRGLSRTEHSSRFVFNLFLHVTRDGT